ncbi:hypothetical protein B0H10DRAFT_518244 [Mycena sp. CBHHK59/15]|nr:hypothetical protein B0H10DRAFT_518244 [Mycena sp. CBHHK59/15]
MKTVETHSGGPVILPSTESSETRVEIDLAQSPSPSRDDQNSPSDIQLKSEEEVIQFLKDCRPPMEELLPIFIGAGVINKEWIKGLQSWPPKNIREFLLRLEADNAKKGFTKVVFHALLLRFSNKT